jgi:membrane protease YdiL (CAAX protease family)
MIPPRPDVNAPSEILDPARYLPDGRLKVTWQWWQALGVIVGGFLLGSIAAYPFLALLGDTKSAGGAAGLSELVQNMVMDVVMVGVIVAWLSLSHRGWVRQLGLPARGKVAKEWLIGGGMGLVVRVGATALSALVVALLTTTTGDKVGLPDQVQSSLSSVGWVVFVVFAVIVAPVTEELVYRGLLFRSLRDRYGLLVGITVSSLLFGLVHYQPGPWLDTLALQITMVGTGAGLALIYEMRKNILAPIAGHMAFNLLAVILRLMSHTG